MQRISLRFASILIVISFSFPFAPGARAASQEEDKRAAELVVRSFEKAVQEFDFDKADSFLTPDARWIEDSYPHPVEPWMRRVLQGQKDAKTRIDFHLQDCEVHVSGDVAWVTITLNSTWEAGPGGAFPDGKSKAHLVFVESESLVRTPGGWKIALGHTTRLAASSGASGDLKQE